MAGVCIGQDGTYLSCWSVEKYANGKYNDNESYLIDPADVEADPSALLSMVPLRASQEITYISEGAWTCFNNPITQGFNYDNFVCIRMLPSEENESETDHRFEKGPVTIYTFKSADFVQEEVVESTNLSTDIQFKQRQIYNNFQTTITQTPYQTYELVLEKAS